MDKDKIIDLFKQLNAEFKKMTANDCIDVTIIDNNQNNDHLWHIKSDSKLSNVKFIQLQITEEKL